MRPPKLKLEMKLASEPMWKKALLGGLALLGVYLFYTNVLSTGTPAESSKQVTKAGSPSPK